MTHVSSAFVNGIADRYEIEGEAGRGGMAVVYSARDVRHGRRVAIKVLEPELAAVLGAERFLREIAIAARLSHSHILPLHDSGEIADQLFYVMPYVEGETLRTRLKREHQLPVDDAVRLAIQVASALDYAHRRNIVHRDIKPENVLLQEGHALVADFGIALAVTAAGGDRLTGTGLSLGTPHYMSPEQAMGERNIDARSDIYSLACMLYEMLAGEPPFTGPNPQAVIARILTEQPRPLNIYRESVSPALQRVVAKALSRLPADRYATAEKFAEALQQAVASSMDTGAVRDVDARAAREQHMVSGRVRSLVRALPWVIAAAAVILAASLWQRPVTNAAATLPNDEVSTEEMQRLVGNDSVVILDTRPHLEYSIAHIPGALNVAARPGIPMSVYISDVAQVRRLVQGDSLRPIVVYCNGPHCPKSQRTATELGLAGFRNVRRYQLGLPVWRAFGGVTEIDGDGLRYVLDKDGTAVVIDTREPATFRAGSIARAKNIPRSGVVEERDGGEIRKAKDDGRLPMQDHGTRVIVIGRTKDEARYVAQALAREAFYNVSYFPGTFEEAWAVVRSRSTMTR